MWRGACRRWEGGVGDGYVAFVFPEGERGVGDVPEADELGRVGAMKFGGWVEGARMRIGWVILVWREKGEGLLCVCDR